MFKYKQKILLPFITLFIICLLFMFINKEDLTYNKKITNQNLSENINVCNKKKKQLNIIPSKKRSNNKILDYVFENLTIKNNNSKIESDNGDFTTFVMPKSEYATNESKLNIINKKIVEDNYKAKQEYEERGNLLKNLLFSDFKKLQNLKSQKAQLTIDTAITDKALAEKTAVAAEKAVDDEKAAADACDGVEGGIQQHLTVEGSDIFRSDREIRNSCDCASFFKDKNNETNDRYNSWMYSKKLDSGNENKCVLFTHGFPVESTEYTRGINLRYNYEGCNTIPTEKECLYSKDGRDDFRGQQCAVVEPQDGAEQRDKESICQPKEWAIEQGAGKYKLINDIRNT
jgi:hypothetical protein